MNRIFFGGAVLIALTMTPAAAQTTTNNALKAQGLSALAGIAGRRDC
jgi:hypothetical protein